jgi:Sulfotransferase domain
MDKVAIFGVPRSGTSWLSQIFNSHPDVALRFQPLFSFGHKGAISESSSSDEVRSFFDDILHSRDAFALMESEMQINYPAFQKSQTPTHTIFKETRYHNVIENILIQCREIRIIGIVRNPLSVLTSWMLAPKEFMEEWDILCEWRGAPSKNQNRPEEFYGFDKWKETTQAFLRFKSQYPQQFFLLRYDELNRLPLETTKKLFDFCGLNICEQVLDFLVASKSRHDSDQYSVFRASANDEQWQKVLPSEITERIIQELKNTPQGIFLQDGKSA